MRQKRKNAAVTSAFNLGGYQSINNSVIIRLTICRRPKIICIIDRNTLNRFRDTDQRGIILKMPPGSELPESFLIVGQDAVERVEKPCLLWIYNFMYNRSKNLL